MNVIVTLTMTPIYLALGVIAADRLGFSALGIRFLAMLVMVFSGLYFSFKVTRFVFDSNGAGFELLRHCRSHPLLLSVFTAFTLAYVIWFLAIKLDTPAFSWDGVSWWLWNGQYFAQQELSFGSAQSFIARDTYPNRHPLTLSVLSVLPHLLFSSDNAWVASAMLWVCPLVGCWCVIIAFGNAFHCPKISIVAAIIMTMIVPLMENHLLIFGYSEAWMTFLVFAGAGYLAIYSKTGRLYNLTLGLMSLCLIPWIRNTGLIYLSVVIFSYGLYWLSSSKSNHLRSSASPVLISTPIFFTAIVLVALLWVAEASISISDSEVIISFAGWVQSMNLQSSVGLVRAAFWSQVINSSFSLLAVTSIIAFLYSRPRSLMKPSSQIFLFYSAVFGNVVLFLVGCISEYFYTYSQPSMDTLGSRSVMPFSALFILFILSLSEGRPHGLAARMNALSRHQS